MMFNQEKFQYISYHMGDSTSSRINNIYLSIYLSNNIYLPKSGEVKDLGILMSQNCDFDSHIAAIAKKCSRLRRRDRYMAIYIMEDCGRKRPQLLTTYSGSHISS